MVENLTRITRRWYLLLFLVAVSTVLTIIAYGPIVGFPFTFDDPIHLRWLEGRSVMAGWTSARELQRYRPLVLSLWAISRKLFGPHDPLPLHLVSLLLHVANASMAGWLASRLIPGDAEAVIAAGLFAVFPFSYQALPSPGSQSKPLSTFLILLACLLYWEGRARRDRAMTLGSVGPAVLAPFAYEGAVTVGGILVLMEFLLWRRKVIERPSVRSLLFILTGPLFVVVWMAVPKSSDLTSFPGWEALWQNSVYFAQALTWPVARLAKPLMGWTGLSDQTATTVVAYPALALLTCLLVWRRRTDVFLAGIVWYVLALAVQWVVLPFKYVIDGPRILYPASVGVAWLWAGLLSPSDLALPRWLGRTVVGVVFIVLTVWSVGFIAERMDMCQAGLSALSEASEKAVAGGAEDTQLFLNLPSWVAPREKGFALGHEGYTVLPEYSAVGLDDFVYVNTGERRTVSVLSLPDIRSQWRGEIGYYGPNTSLEGVADPIRNAARVWSLDYREDGLGLVEFGSVRTSTVVGSSGEVELAVFGDAVALEEIAVREVNSSLRLDLTWRSLRALSGPYTVFVHVYAADGQLVAQGDGLPLGGTYPFTYWRAGDAVHDVRHVTLHQDLSAGQCVIGVGLYRSDTGERAPATGAGGSALADRMFRMTTELVRRG